MTDRNDQRETQCTICLDCGEDLEWHECGVKPSEKTLRIRELNDALRTDRDHIAVMAAKGQLVITRGIAARGDDFLIRAVDAVRAFDSFTEDNDRSRWRLRLTTIAALELYFSSSWASSSCLNVNLCA
jgi:hypothetical protein